MKSLMKLKDAIRDRTRRQRSGTIQQVVGELNAVLRGWYNYFRHAVFSTFRPIDEMVRRRLRTLLRTTRQAPRPRLMPN